MADLGQLIKAEGPLPLDDAVGWALRVGKTLQQLHSFGLAHGHISLHALLCDSRSTDAEATMASASGLELEPGYQGPERAGGEPPSPADDVWAAGVVLYVALTGCEPFEDIGADHAAPLDDHGIDAPEVQAVLDRIFHAERSERILSAHDLVAVLSKRHPTPDDMEPLELPIEGVRSAHRVRHASQQVMEAVREEIESLRPTAPGEPPEPGEAGDGDQDHADGPTDDDEAPDADARSSEVAFLGWLSEPPAGVEPTEAPVSIGTPEIEAEPISVSPRELLPDPEPVTEIRESEVREPESRESESRESESEPESESREPVTEASFASEARDAEVAEPRNGEQPEARESEVRESESPDSEPEVRESEPAAAAPTRPAAPADKSNNNLLWVIGAVVVVVIAYYGLRTPEAPPRPTPKPVASARPAPSQPSTAAPPATAPAAALSVPRPTTATASASPLGASARDQCMISQFASDTFDEPPDFGPVCARLDPIKGSRAIKRMVVTAAKGTKVSDAMVEWSRLAWYEMGAFAVMQARCCEQRLDLAHARFNVCKMRDALEALQSNARQGGEALDAAVGRYAKSVSCIWRSDNAKLFFQASLPTAQQRDYFEALVKRPAK